MTPDLFFLFAPQAWGRRAGVWFLGGRPTWSVSLGADSLCEEEGSNEKPRVSGFLWGASFEIPSGNFKPQDGATSSQNLDSFGKILENATDWWEEK